MIPVTVDRNYVEVLGHHITRPSAISPSQWMEFWEPLDGDHQFMIDRANGSKKK